MSFKKNVKRYAAYKGSKIAFHFLKKAFVALIGAIGPTACLVILALGLFYTLIAKDGSSDQGVTSFVKFSPEVEAYRAEVMQACESEGIIEYVNHILAIMQVETAGRTLDPMNAGDKSFNTRYPKQRGAIDDPSYSITVGVKEFKQLLELCGVTDFADTTDLLIAYQAYHFNHGYIDFARAAGGYTTYNAQTYLRQSTPLPYYLKPSFATTVLSYVTIISGYVDNFQYPVDIEDSQIAYSFGEPVGGIEASGTFFQADGPVYAITDGEVIYADEHNFVMEHGNYTIKYWYLDVSEEFLPDEEDDEEESDGEEDEEEEEEEPILVSKGDDIGEAIDRGRPYNLMIQILVNGRLIDPMTLINLKVSDDYEADTGNNNVRDAIVDYAKIFMETPYVWGGTSLQTGVDCSGFVQQLYKNFGYSIPRVSRDQANYKNAVWSTTDVIPDVLLKGDLLFYTDESGTVNHVTMYIGNGLIIGAQSTKTGIKITHYNYRQPVKAIRIIA